MHEWMKLDNAAKIYPPMLSKHWAVMFRISVELVEEVDISVLKKAQDLALKRIPSFSYCLKKGLFWYYLEKIDGAPPIIEDVDNPLQSFDFKKNNHFLYRLLVYKNRIAIEVFHSLADGTGGLTFLLTLVSCYLSLKYSENINPNKYILDINKSPSEEEYCDSFLKYSNQLTIPLKEKIAYRVPGRATDFNRLLMVCGTVETEKLKQLAKSYNASITQFISSILLYSVIEIQKQDKNPFQKNRMAKVSIPVNLRQFFPSKTLRNFSSFINPGLYTKLGDYTIEEIIEYVKNYMSIYTTPKQLRAKFSFNVEAEKNPFIRIVPLFLKKPILQASYYFAGDIYYSTTISNLGQVTLDHNISKYIERMDFMLGRSLQARSTVGCISFNGKTYFNFTRTLKNSELERIFFSKLVSMGLNVFIESNGKE